MADFRTIHIRMKVSFRLLCFWVLQILCCFASVDSAEADERSYGSPFGPIELRLTEPADSRAIKVVVNHQVVASYHFMGELRQILWNESGKLVAVENHFGHAGYYIWIFSLPDGHVVGADSPQDSDEYDRYVDYAYIPDIREVGGKAILKVYNEFDRSDKYFAASNHILAWSGEAELVLVHQIYPVRLVEAMSVIIALSKVRCSDPIKLIGSSILAWKVKQTDEMDSLPGSVRKAVEEVGDLVRPTDPK